MLPTVSMKFPALIAAFFTAAALTAQEPTPPTTPVAETAPAPASVPDLPNPQLDVPPLSLTPQDPPNPTEPPKPTVPEEEPLLPVPAGPILDQAGVLRPDAVARLTAALSAARTQDVWVYVLTVPSLRVLPSKQKEKLEALAKRYIDAWAPRTVGAILLFDDEGGLMSLQTSKEAEDRFSAVAIQIGIEERLVKLRTEGLAREKLEQMALIATDALGQLQSQYVADSARQRRTNLLMGGLALIGVGLAVWSALAGSKPSAPATDAPDPEKIPPPAV